MDEYLIRKYVFYLKAFSFEKSIKRHSLMGKILQ